MTSARFTRHGLLAVLVAVLLAAWAGTSSVEQETKPGARGDIAERAASANDLEGFSTFAFPGQPVATQPPTTPQSSPSASPTPTQRTRMPAWLKLVVGAVAIIFAVTVARRAGRRGNTSRP